MLSAICYLLSAIWCLLCFLYIHLFIHTDEANHRVIRSLRDGGDGRQPASQPANQQASQPYSSQPSSHPGSQQAACLPGTHLVSQLASGPTLADEKSTTVWLNFIGPLAEHFPFLDSFSPKLRYIVLSFS